MIIKELSVVKCKLISPASRIQAAPVSSRSLGNAIKSSWGEKKGSYTVLSSRRKPNASLRLWFSYVLSFLGSFGFSLTIQLKHSWIMLFQVFLLFIFLLPSEAVKAFQY